MTITTCPDCGASPAETRCDCDFLGIRVARRIAELERALADAIGVISAQEFRIAELRRRLAEAEAEAEADTARPEWMQGGNGKQD